MSVEQYHDIKIRRNEDSGMWDINFGEDGDFELEDTFDTSLLISLFVDARAEESEVPNPLERRGFWGDVVLFKNDPDIESGSKIWLARGRRTEAVRNKIIDYSQKALQWLITRSYAKEVRVDADFTTNGITLNITIYITDNAVKKFTLALWENGFVNEVTPL